MFNTIFHVLLHTLKDSIITLPVLFVCYLLIELLEEKILKKYQSSKMVKSKWAPVVSAGFGLIPQCGFSVVASDLYSRKMITLGSLFAIFIATSDEAVPLMLSYPNNYLNLIIILVVKFIYAVIIGFVIDIFFLRKNNKTEILIMQEKKLNEEDEQIHEVEGCCKHKLEHKHNKIKELFVHPLIHSLKIFGFILIINFVFGLIIEFLGENIIASFMMTLGFFEPFVVTLVGLVPNCAASFIITETFLNGTISLGSCIAGLCVNSGIAMVTLFKLNKKLKENILILLSLFLLSCALGVIINLF